MSPAKISWSVVIALCALAATLLALEGYAGYSVTLGAVGVAAAVNLLP